MKRSHYIAATIGMAVIGIYGVLSAADRYKPNPYTGKPDNVGEFSLFSTQYRNYFNSFINYTGTALKKVTFTTYTGIDRVAYSDSIALMQSHGGAMGMIASHTQLVSPSAHGNAQRFSNASSHQYSIQPYGSHTAAGAGDGDIQYNYHGEPRGAAFLRYSSPNTYISSGNLLITGGKVGIGTTSPSQLLEVVSNSASNVPVMLYAGTAGGTLPNARPLLGVYRARGTSDSALAVQNNDKLGSFSFSGYDGATFQTPSLLESFVDGTVSSGVIPARLSVVTGSNVSTRAERLVIKNDGKVGLGTTTPRGNFDNHSSVTGKGKQWTGSDTNYVYHSQDLGVRYKGNTTTWKDLRIEPIARSGAGIATAPAYASSPWDALLFNYKFVNAGGEYLYYSIQTDHDWLESSGMYPHIHFVPHTTGTGQVDFDLYCSWATPMTGTFGTGSTYSVSYNIASNSQYKHLIASNATAQSMAGILISSVASCRMTRSASDTYAGDVSVLYIDYHYEVDSPGGSDSEYSKTVTP